MSNHTTVHNCSACGGNHGVMYYQLKKPVEINGKVYTHAGTCPVTLMALYISLSED